VLTAQSVTSNFPR